MNNSYWTLFRIARNPFATFGVLMKNGHPICVTLEPPDLKNRKNVSNIPQGRYVCKPTVHWTVDGEKYDAYMVTKVENRTNIHIHIGNFPKDTSGCILVGRRFETKRNAICESKLAFQDFMEHANGETFILRIIDFSSANELDMPHMKGLIGDIRRVEELAEEIVSTDVKTDGLIHGVAIKPVEWVAYKLNGKKTILGIAGTILGIGMLFIPQTAPYAPQVISGGLAMTGLGGAHKVLKEWGPGEKGTVDWKELFNLIIEFIKSLINRKK